MHRHAWPALLLVVAACASAPPTRRSEVAQKYAETPAPAVAAPLAPRLEAAFPKLEAAAQEEAAKGSLPNLVVGLVADGRLVWSKGLGQRDPSAPEPPDARSLFRIGSITKVFTGAALLALRDQGKLDLDAPAALYLPELDEVLYPTRDSPPITVRHLVTHSSGLPRVGKLDYARSDRELTETDIFAALRGTRLDFAPGTRSVYSNLAMAVAGLIVGRVAGVPYPQFVQQALFVPLGIINGKFDGAAVDPAHLAAGHKGKAPPYEPIPVSAHWRLGAGASMGGLYLDLEDFARFAAFEMSAWPPRNDPDPGPLKRSSLRESQMPAGSVVGTSAFGVNWAVADDPKFGHVVTHTGSTEDYSASIRLLPRRGLGVIAMTGCGDADRVSALAKALLELASDAAPPEATLGPTYELVLGRVKKLLDAPDAAGVDGAFSPSFLKAITREKVVDLFNQVRKVGACAGRKVVLVDESHAVVRLTCEKASIDVGMHASPEPPHLLEGFWIKDAK